MLTAPRQGRALRAVQDDEAVKCTTKPVLDGHADGERPTGRTRRRGAKLGKAGYYTYRESIVESACPRRRVTTTCGQTVETSFAYGDAKLDDGRLTRRRAARLEDRGRDQHHRARPDRCHVEVSLYGPFGSRAAIGCGGKPYWAGKLTAHGDGTVKSKAVAIRQVGFYTYREHVVGTDLVASATTECAITEETSLARPLVITGRGDIATHAARPARARPAAPVRVELASVGIDAPVTPVGIDLKAGRSVSARTSHRTGWWKDGALPGDPKQAPC